MMKLRQPLIISVFLLLIQCYLVKNEDIIFEDYRLNNEVIPESYDIQLDLSEDFSKNTAFNGEVKIVVKFKNSTEPSTKKAISLHVSHIEIAEKDAVEIYALDNPGEIITPEIYINSTVQMVILTLKESETLDSKKQYQINIKYKGKLHDDMYGLYRSSYLDEDNVTQWIATTQFQATYARRAFPCFDEPAQKAEFLIEIKHTSEYHALSNAKIIESKVEDESGKIITKFAKTPRMSTYLIAMVVSKFPKISQNNVNNIDHGLYAPKEVIGTGQYAFIITPKLLNVLKNFTKVSYEVSNLGKIDQVAIPDFAAGAMENWGLVTYRETALLWDPAESSSKNKERVATVIAHELAHMWFGNLITLEWWSYTWLNEGFARYYQYHATAEVERQWELDLQFVVEQQQSVFIPDANKAVDALTSDCYTPSEISSKFGTISYNKGASVIRMMEHFMGKDNFYLGIQKYFKDSFFTNTNPDLLWNAMSGYVNENDTFLKTNFKAIMTDWTEQAGFPVVQVNIENVQIFISQQRFLYGENDTETKWYIPITYTDSTSINFTSTTPKLWLGKNAPIALPWNPETKWILFNIQESGYYRVQYDDALYKLLENALKENKFSNFPVLNRAQIVDDALNLARAGYLAYSVALDVVEYLKEELDYYPWYSAFNGFAYLKRRIDGKSELAKLLDEYITLLMTNFYNSVKFEEGYISQIINHKRVLALTWACELHEEKCIQNSQEHFRKLELFDVEVDPNIRSVVYCTTIRNAKDNASWNYLWNRFTHTQSAAESVTILSALGCALDEEIIQNYLQLSINATSKIRSQDALSVFTSVIIGNSENVPIALTFLENHFREIAENYGSLNALSSVITNLADRLTTSDQIDILENFVDDNYEELKDAVEVAERAIKSAKENLKWVEENEKVLLDYFKTKQYPDTDNSASTKSMSLITGTVLLIIYYYIHDFIFV